MDENIIHLNEAELYNLIGTVVREVMEREFSKYTLNEMAINLSEYRKKVEDRMQQILENWCLVRYVSLTGDRILLKEHWKTELLAHLIYISSLKLKNGDSILSKEKAIYKLWNDFEFDNDENVIMKRMHVKFKIEKIPTNTEVYIQIAQDFKNAARDIVSALLAPSRSAIEEYIETI